MALPDFSAYSAAIQHPEVAFRSTDPELATCKPESTRLGPKPRSGGFAVTYKLIGQREWAVRCFHKPIGDLEKRYSDISRFLKANPRGFFVDFTYRSSGILVSGQAFPIVKMHWVNDPTLGAYLEKKLC